MNIDETLAYLKKHGSEIRVACHDNPLAMVVIQTYNMYYACPEAGAEAMLIGATEDWIKKFEKRGDKK